MGKSMIQKMREDAIRKKIDDLKELQKNDDIEYAHYEADEILLDIIGICGYPEVQEVFKSIPRWYA